MSNQVHLAFRSIGTVALAAILIAASGAAYAESHSKTETGKSAVAMGRSWQGKAHDAWIDGKIEASYALNRYLSPFEIDTAVEEGVVRLSGTVDSQIDKDLAGEIAEGIDGVTEVKNDLVVEPRAKSALPMKEATSDFGRHVEDAMTTARVKLALLANDSTEGLEIDVDTENGMVSLEGAVDSAQESELAERIAANTEGVEKVENRLTVADES